MILSRVLELLWRTIFSDCRLLAVFLIVLIAVRLVQIYRENKRLPPGPWGLPFIGYLPFFKGYAHLHYKELAKKFGPIFSTKLGNQLIVVLSDYKTIRETFRQEEFTGRPQTEFSDILGGYGKYFLFNLFWLSCVLLCFC